MNMTRAALVGVLMIVASCGGDDDQSETSSPVSQTGDTAGSPASGPPATALATECDSSGGNPNRTITINIDDEVGGFGSIGSQTPSGLKPGKVRVVVNADPENAGPVTVTVKSGDKAWQIAGVEAGSVCGASFRVGPGDYVVTSDVNSGDAAFTVSS